MNLRFIGNVSLQYNQIDFLFNDMISIFLQDFVINIYGIAKTVSCVKKYCLASFHLSDNHRLNFLRNVYETDLKRVRQIFISEI